MKKKYFVIPIFFACLLFGIWWYNKAPLISVVMPVYNRHDLVPRAINSILNQTISDFEFVIIDDGSDDKTKEVLKSFAKKDKRIRLYHNNENKGISFSRQRGLDLAKGEFVAIMDSDDYSVPDRFEKSLAFMRDHPDVDAMCGDIEYMGIGTTPYLNYKPTGEKYEVLNSTGSLVADFVFANAFANVSSFFKRQFVLDNNISYNLDFISAEDYDFWVQFALKGAKMASMKNLLVYVRDHQSNSNDYYYMQISKTYWIRHKLLSRFFEPLDSDIKYKMNLYERCKVLQKILATNKTSDIFWDYFKMKYQKSCPADFSKSYFLRHLGWSDFLNPIGNDMYKRAHSHDKARITKKDNQLIVEWENWPPEIFELFDGYYYLKIENKLK